MGVAKHMLTLLLCLVLLLLKAHSKCPKSYACGNFTLEFPFTISNDSDCGSFIVDGCDSQIGRPTLRSEAPTAPYHILGKTSTNKFLVQDVGLQKVLRSSTCLTFTNLSLPQSPFGSLTFSPNLTFFACYNRTPLPHIHDYFQSYRSLRCNISTLYYKITETDRHAPSVPPGCLLTQLPIKSDNNSTQLLHLLTADFTLEWNVSQDCNDCYNGGGQCLTDNQHQFYCRKKGSIYYRAAALFIDIRCDLADSKCPESFECGDHFPLQSNSGVIQLPIDFSKRDTHQLLNLFILPWWIGGQ